MDILAENDVLLYVFLSMLCTWFVQINSRHYRKASRWERARNGFVCSIFTAAVCIPMCEYFTGVPPSLSLLVGVVVGTLGIEGWNRLITLGMDIVQWRFTGSPYQRPPLYPRGGGAISTREDDDADEPPMPIRKKKP